MHVNITRVIVADSINTAEALFLHHFLFWILLSLAAGGGWLCPHCHWLGSYGVHILYTVAFDWKTMLVHLPSAACVLNKKLQCTYLQFTVYWGIAL